MKTLKDVLATYLQQHPQYQTFNLVHLLERWEELLGAFIARKMVPVAFDRGILVCQVSHSTLIQELSFLEGEILAKIRLFEGGEQIRSLRWVLSPPLRRQDAEQLKQIQQAHQQRLTTYSIPSVRQISLQQEQAIQQQTSVISDQALRQHSTRFLRALARRQQQLKQQNWQVCLNCQSYYEPFYQHCPHCKWMSHE